MRINKHMKLSFAIRVETCFPLIRPSICLAQFTGQAGCRQTHIISYSKRKSIMRKEPDIYLQSVGKSVYINQK